MSKELKPCHLLDRLREWFELYGNQNRERAEEELHLAIDELYEYQQNENRIADLEAKLAELNKEPLNCSQLENGMSLCVIQKSRIKELEAKLTENEKKREYLFSSNCEYVSEIEELKQQLSEKEEILERQKIDQLYLELLFTRLQWIHKEADKCREEKERFGGIEDMALNSVWCVLDLQKHECCGYEEMAELEDGIGYIAEDKLLRTIEHDLNFKATRTENEILAEIKQLTHQHEDKGE